VYTAASGRYAGVIYELVKKNSVLSMVMTIFMTLFLFSILCALIILYVIYWRIIALLQLLTSVME